MDDTSIEDHILYPFCGCPGIEAKPGKTFCHKCNYYFSIDDRVECVFADPKNLKLPLTGTVCPICGLVQGEDSEYCVYCNNLNILKYVPDLRYGMLQGFFAKSVT